MKTVLVTGAEGFIGQEPRGAAQDGATDINVLCFDVDSGERKLEEYLASPTSIYHLAGVNRPPDPSEHEAVNTGLTATSGRDACCD